MKIITPIDEAIAESLRKVPVSSGDDLLGFDMDLFHYLDRHGQFSQLKTYQTGDPRCALVAECAAGKKLRSVSEVAATLTKIWMEWVRYSYYEAHEVTQEADKLIFRFVTRSGDGENDLCVTGKIIVEGAGGAA